MGEPRKPTKKKSRNIDFSSQPKSFLDQDDWYQDTDNWEDDDWKEDTPYTDSDYGDELDPYD
jgi:hypothetical protein